VPVSLWLYLPLLLSLILEQAPQALETLPSPGRRSGLLLEGFLRDPVPPCHTRLRHSFSPSLFLPVPAVIIVNKTGLLFTLNRVTGKPIFKASYNSATPSAGELPLKDWVALVRATTT